MTCKTTKTSQNLIFAIYCFMKTTRQKLSRFCNQIFTLTLFCVYIRVISFHFTSVFLFETKQLKLSFDRIQYQQKQCACA